MTLRRATPHDAPAIAAFLHDHVQTSMFPLANLRDHGIGGTAPRGLQVWLDGAIRGLVAVTNEGMLLPQMPVADLSAALRPLLDQPLIGAIGEAGQVRALLRGLGLDTAPTRLNADEPGFDLALDALTMPDATGARLLTPTAAEAPLLVEWRTAYHIEHLGTPLSEAQHQAAGEVAGYLARDSHRLLLCNGAPVSMTGFNATVGTTVQIGGVYTPPALRGRGHARLAVALHLDQARHCGIARAVLFAASAAAATAYRAIGFQPAHTMALVLFDGPQRASP